MKKAIKTKIQAELHASAKLNEIVSENQAQQIATAAQMLTAAIRRGKKVLICGNGGSAADADHFAAELLGRFKKNRRALPAVALTAGPATLTALGNDFGFETIFEKQVEGLAQPGDIVIGISTSGKSKNVLRALKKAQKIGAKTLALSGNPTDKTDINSFIHPKASKKSAPVSKNDLNRIEAAADISITVPSFDTPRIQEAHITIIHILCRLVEDTLFGKTLVGY